MDAKQYILSSLLPLAHVLAFLCDVDYWNFQMETGVMGNKVMCSFMVIYLGNDCLMLLKILHSTS